MSGMRKSEVAGKNNESCFKHVCPGCQSEIPFEVFAELRGNLDETAICPQCGTCLTWNEKKEEYTKTNLEEE